METVDKIVTFAAYKDDDGNPCCAKQFGTGEVCIFYRTAKFGLIETCAFLDTHVSLKRRNEGIGTLIPCDKCILWNKEKITDNIGEPNG